MAFIDSWYEISKEYNHSSLTSYNSGEKKIKLMGHQLCNITFFNHPIVLAIFRVSIFFFGLDFGLDIDAPKLLFPQCFFLPPPLELCPWEKFPVVGLLVKIYGCFYRYL